MMLASKHLTGAGVRDQIISASARTLRRGQKNQKTKRQLKPKMQGCWPQRWRPEASALSTPLPTVKPSIVPFINVTASGSFSNSFAPTFLSVARCTGSAADQRRPRGDLESRSWLHAVGA